MPLTRVKHGRNTTIVIEAYGEVLFAPGAPFGKWGTIFEKRLLGFTREFAPFNKRPHWMHYGVNLRNSFDSSIRHNPVNLRIDLAVGSSAPHALYVDQGTGIFGGNGPYPAAILPPWTRGGASLYEATWRPGGPNGRRVRPVMIKGQPGQHFFQDGLDRTMLSMLRRSYQLPADPRIIEVLGSVPTSVIDASMAGNPNAGLFGAQLKQWREWRKKRWDAGGVLGKGRGGGTNEWARRKAKRAAKAERDARRARDPKAAAMAEAREKYLRKLDEARERREEDDRIRAHIEEKKRKAREAKQAEKDAEAKRQRTINRRNREAAVAAKEFYQTKIAAGVKAQIGHERLKSGLIMWWVRFQGPEGIYKRTWNTK